MQCIPSSTYAKIPAEVKAGTLEAGSWYCKPVIPAKSTVPLAQNKVLSTAVEKLLRIIPEQDSIIISGAADQKKIMIWSEGGLVAECTPLAVCTLTA